MPIPRQKFTVTRFSTSDTYVDGILQAPTEETLEIKASKQPVNNGERNLPLFEGRREVEAYKLYTSTKLRAVDKDSNLNADKVDIDGESFEVVSVGIWQNNVRSHYKVMVTKSNNG